MLTDGMEHVIRLLLKEKISVWTGNDVKHIDPRELHQIQILSRVLYHVMQLKQNTNGANRFFSDNCTCTRQYTRLQAKIYYQPVTSNVINNLYENIIFHG